MHPATTTLGDNLESTANFKAGLKTAYDELDREGKLSETDHRVVGELLRRPVRTGRNGERIFAMKRAHFRVRRYYARKTGIFLPFEIDWTKITAWIKEHWVDIVKILVSLLMFI